MLTLAVVYILLNFKISWNVCHPTYKLWLSKYFCLSILEGEMRHVCLKRFKLVAIKSPQPIWDCQKCRNDWLKLQLHTSFHFCHFPQHGGIKKMWILISGWWFVSLYSCALFSWMDYKVESRRRTTFFPRERDICTILHSYTISRLLAAQIFSFIIQV